MFETLPNPSLQTVLIAGRAVALIGAFWIFALAFTRWRRAQELANQQLHDQLQRALVEIRSLQDSVALLGSRFATSSVPHAPLPVVQAAPTAAQRGYDLALRMVRNGASVDALMANCGLPRNEAELLVRLHAARSAEAQPQSNVAHPSSRPAAQAPSWSNWTQPSSAPTPPPTPPPAKARRGSLLSVAG